MSGFVDGYNKLVLRKKEILDRGTPQDIRLPEINAALAALKNSIYSSINSLRQQLRTANALIASQEQNQTGRFQGMAEKRKGPEPDQPGTGCERCAVHLLATEDRR